MGTLCYIKGVFIPEKIERKNSMSFNCIYMNDDYIMIGSDSRETFADGTYNDHFQKVFSNQEQSMIWSITGLYKYRNIDYTILINDIMNMSTDVYDKIFLIQHLMTFPTRMLSNERKTDCIFDMLIGTVDKGILKVFVIEIKNGIIDKEVNKEYLHLDFPISSGVSLHFSKYLNLEIMDRAPTLNEKILEMKRLVNLVINEDKSGTVGGNARVVALTAGRIVEE